MGGLSGWLGGKQILKGLLYLLSLARLSIAMGGSCGFCGHVFIVYALYLSLINAALMSAVTDTSEQRSDLTQCADDFLPTFKALERSKTLPPACLFEPEQEDRCSRKTHTKPNLSICVPTTPQVHVFFWKPSSCFQHALRCKRKFKDMFFRHYNGYTRFPQMKARGPDADHSRGSPRGLSDPPPCGYSIQPISVIGLLFSNDLLTDKWCVTNFIIMQLVFPEKWNPEILYSWKLNEHAVWH